MNIIFTTLIVAMFSATVIAQGQPGGDGPGAVLGASTYGGGTLSFADASLFKKAIDRGEMESYDNIDGSPYLSDDHINGTIITNNGTVIKDVPIKIDLYSHNINATNYSGEDIVLYEKYYKELIIPFEGQDLVFKKLNPSKPTQFYEVVYEDNSLVFFKERYVNIKEGSNQGLSSRPAKFSHRSNYYIIKDDRAPEKVRLKKKDIFSFFSKSEVRSMESYAKRKKLKCKSEADFVAVFKGLNE